MKELIATPEWNTLVCGFSANYNYRYHLVTITEKEFKWIMENYKENKKIIEEDSNETISEDLNINKSIKIHNVNIKKPNILLVGEIDDKVLTHKMLLPYIHEKYYDGRWYQTEDRKLSQTYGTAVDGLKYLAKKLIKSKYYAILQLSRNVTFKN